MWNRRSLLLFYRVHARAEKRSIRVHLYMAIYVLHQLILSIEGITGLIPGNAGRFIRGAVDSVHGLILGIMELPPQQLLHIDVTAEGKPIKVDARTIGF